MFPRSSPEIVPTGGSYRRVGRKWWSATGWELSSLGMVMTGHGTCGRSCLFLTFYYDLLCLFMQIYIFLISRSVFAFYVLQFIVVFVNRWNYSKLCSYSIFLYIYIYISIGSVCRTVMSAGIVWPLMAINAKYHWWLYNRALHGHTVLLLLLIAHGNHMFSIFNVELLNMLNMNMLNYSMWSSMNILIVMKHPNVWCGNASHRCWDWMAVYFEWTSHQQPRRIKKSNWFDITSENDHTLVLQIPCGTLLEADFKGSNSFSEGIWITRDRLLFITTHDCNTSYSTIISWSLSVFWSH